MDATYTTSLGDRGRLVVPAALRESQGWTQGTPLLFIETDRAVLVATRAQAKALIRSQLAGADLVDELLAERREAARREDVA
ncbi:AbrB/MazE/SpoVT family DNA-binding domain-containing protein [Galbitalea sp. SE-J8]|uniref:AbrB/MazE/SpoVT family DNA-binding domain-containing protein n=1 Tax=Galbitalea sp. SE-J8 TaxID=3054952 RepID=UPI00259CBBA8|nr:AbrB/MazE/SpoVT family DNA-binding domain-containing protein [Galbitalea sp. SE-J8]MDM4763259.1 AbrB/MazE/SpoVT family DNA-binding domain-containing protein [Galbitalea sp. SE-J8]